MWRAVRTEHCNFSERDVEFLTPVSGEALSEWPIRVSAIRDPIRLARLQWGLLPARLPYSGLPEWIIAPLGHEWDTQHQYSRAVVDLRGNRMPAGAQVRNGRLIPCVRSGVHSVVSSPMLSRGSGCLGTQPVSKASRRRGGQSVPTAQNQRRWRFAPLLPAAWASDSRRGQGEQACGW